MRARLVALLAALPLVVPSLHAAAAPAYVGDPIAEGVGKDLVPVAHIAYKSGTDLEFARVKGHDYAVAPSQGSTGGLRLINIDKPEKPRVTGFLECAVTQNDVQVRGTLVLMGVDGGVKQTDCFDQAKADPGLGLVVVSIANPARPKAIGFVKVPFGVHNATWHPGGRYVYTSDSELTPKTGEKPGAMGGRIQIIDIGNPKAPKLVSTLPLPANAASAHDITFNKSGDRAYVAGITTTLILNTSKPATPTITSTIVDPSVNISHGADPTPDGKYLLVTDEQAGALANGVCNVGGVHVFDITNELVPVKVGFWALDPRNSLTATITGDGLTCTAHVLDYAPDGKSWSNGDYVAGVRIVSAQNMVGAPAELAWFTPVDAVTWSAKTYRTPKYLFANDLNRGFDVYRWEPGKGAVDTRKADTKKLKFRVPTAYDARNYCYELPSRARD